MDLSTEVNEASLINNNHDTFAKPILNKKVLCPRGSVLCGYGWNCTFWLGGPCWS